MIVLAANEHIKLPRRHTFPCKAIMLILVQLWDVWLSVRRRNVETVASPSYARSADTVEDSQCGKMLAICMDSIQSKQFLRWDKIKVDSGTHNPTCLLVSANATFLDML